MSRQRLSTLLLASLSRSTVRPMVLRCWTARPVPVKACRSLATSPPLGRDSSRMSSPGDDAALEKDSTPGENLTLPDPDPSRPIVEYDTLNGRVRRNIKVSAKTNANTLVTALSPLLSAPTSKLKSIKSVSSSGWQLQPDDASIIRFFAFDSEADATKFVASVRTAADEMDHHPEIATSVARTDDTTPVGCVAISCSTHRPPGLSMRDVRLARKIDELTEPFNYMANNTDLTSRTVPKAIRRDLLHQLQSQRSGK
jgi:4a-hydroxytetrahydrobiopterin dehydratase